MTIRQVFFAGRWWTKLTPPWTHGPRPTSTYIPCTALADLARP